MALEHIIADLVDAIDHSSPAELDRARGTAEGEAADFEIKSTKRATFKRLAAVLRDEMGPL
jgi:hypothetical protein